MRLLVSVVMQLLVPQFLQVDDHDQFTFGVIVGGTGDILGFDVQVLVPFFNWEFENPFQLPIVRHFVDPDFLLDSLAFGSELRFVGSGGFALVDISDVVNLKAKFAFRIDQVRVQFFGPLSLDFLSFY